MKFHHVWRHRWIRVVSVGLAAIMAIATGWLLLVFPRFDQPRLDPPQHSDVIYLLGGERYGAGMGLSMLDEGLGDALVLSWTDYNLPECLEGFHGGRPVLCIEPQPATTQGEAMVLPSLMEDHGWSSVTVVTWPAHVPRTRLLFERCYSGDMRFGSTNYPYGRRERVVKAFYETISWAKASATPGCDDMLPFGLSG